MSQVNDVYQINLNTWHSTFWSLRPAFEERPSIVSASVTNLGCHHVPPRNQKGISHFR